MEPTAKRLLEGLRSGNASAREELWSVAYDELRAIAAGFLRAERPGHTLQTTALMHEAYLRIVGSGEVPWESRAQFFAVASEAVRRVLVEHARRRATEKRGGGWHRISLHDSAAFEERPLAEFLALNEVLTRLSSVHERQGRVVEMRFFGGMSVAEVAHVLGVSESTVRGDWRFARAWLHRELSRSGVS